jgi:hypothetical protein
VPGTAHVASSSALISSNATPEARRRKRTKSSVDLSGLSPRDRRGQRPDHLTWRRNRSRVPDQFCGG